MNFTMSDQLKWILTVVFGFLTLASVIGIILKYSLTNETQKSVVANLNTRIKAWWMMCIIFSLVLLIGPWGSVALFTLTSFLALREYITLTPTKPADHRTLFWAFFIILPLHYYFVGSQWYGMFSIFIPVYAFIFLPMRSVVRGDSDRFLERTAKIQWGLMVCVYCLSHAPALLTLNIPGYSGRNAQLLFFLVLVVEMSDVFQYIFGKIFGRRKVAPQISPNKTLEGFVGGILAATCLGTGLWWLTPFSIVEAAGLSFLIALMGFYGGLTMSAIKRDRGVKDFGSSIQGHGGILDRIDSLCFSAPIFFHIVRYFYI